MHGRAFAADRSAAEQGGERQRHLAGSHLEREEARTEILVFDFQRGNGLRDAGPAGRLQGALGKPAEQGEHRRRNDQWHPPAVRGNGVEHVEGEVRGLREEHGGQADDDGTRPEEDAATPLLGRQPVVLAEGPEPVEVHLPSGMRDQRTW